ncbi:hypothetical protein [Bacillus sp. 0909A]
MSQALRAGSMPNFKE